MFCWQPVSKETYLPELKMALLCILFWPLLKTFLNLGHEYLLGKPLKEQISQSEAYCTEAMVGGTLNWSSLSKVRGQANPPTQL